MGNKVGIVYGVFDRAIRRIVMADDDSHLEAQAQTVHGQEVLIVTSKQDYAHRGATGLADSYGLVN